MSRRGKFGMSKIFVRKLPGGSLVPCDDEGVEFIKKMKPGEQVSADITRPRNLKFHRKFFALMNMGFEYFEPPKQEWRGFEAVKNFDVFREQITILAGYREVTFNIDGSPKVKAISISFGRMEEDDFNKLYKAVFSVIWARVIVHIQGFTEADMERVVNEMLSFG